MALFPKIKEVKYFQWPSGYTQALSSSEVVGTFIIPRQSRRLEMIRLHLNITVTTSNAAATSPNYLEGILPRIELKASDAAGSQRSVFLTNSASVLIRNRIQQGFLDAKTLQCLSTVAVGTYDMFLDLPLRYWNMSETVGHRTSLPLSSPALADDVKLILTLASFADINLANTSAVTVNSTNVILQYRELPDTVGYIPTEFITNSYAWGGGSGNLYYDFPQNGMLGGFLVEEFSNATTRGTVLSGVGAGSGLGKWKFRYGRSDREEWYTNEQIADNQLTEWAQYGGVTPVLTAAWYKDFLHDNYVGEALSGGSLYNLYAANAGDRAQLNCTNLAAGGITLISSYKFLTTQPNDLLGA
jgi:hypothetical protein